MAFQGVTPARSAHPWNLQTLGYLFATDSIHLSSFTSTRQATEKAV